VLRKPSLKQVQKQVGRRLRAARLAAGMTQEKAAAAASVDYKRYQSLESGLINATLKTLLRLANALGVQLWQLMRDD
jgi:transcriptional regulator with XRE-family HTH domain